MTAKNLIKNRLKMRQMAVSLKLMVASQRPTMDRTKRKTTRKIKRSE